MTPDCAVAKLAQAGKYLSFRLGNEEYGLEILRVQEIVGATGVSPLPLAPGHLRGRLHLRGRAVPVVGLRELFGLEPVMETEKNCVIVAQLPLEGGVATMGLLVDEVCEVVNIAEDEIQFPPSLAGGMEEPEFINGLGQLKDRDVFLLESDHFFSEEELKAMVEWDD